MTSSPYVVAAAGLRRSGSTWLYNCARLALSKPGHEVLACFSNRYPQASSASAHVVKCHEFRSAICKRASMVLLSVRDFRDIAASAVRFGIVPNHPADILAFLRNELASYEQWRAYASLVVPYADIVLRTAEVVTTVTELLEVPEVATSTAKDLEGLRPTGEYCRLTKLHPGHVTDGRIGSYNATLSRRTVGVIEDVFAGYCSREVPA